MKIFIAVRGDDYELCYPVDRDFGRITALVNGERRCETWKPIAMQILREDEGKRLLESDSPWLGSWALIFRQRALQGIVGEMLREHGELLPLFCPGAELWIYNATRVIDALDEEASSVWRFGNGDIMRVNRHVLRSEVIGRSDIFRIPRLRVSPTYLSRRFVEAWRSGGRRGLNFVEVFSTPADLA